MTRMKKLALMTWAKILLLLVFLLFSANNAQIDARALELLDGCPAEAALSDAETIEFSMFMTILEPNSDLERKMQLHMAVDYKERRLASTTIMELEGGDFIMKVVYTDGEAKAYNSLMGMVMPFSAEEAEALTRIFEQPANNLWINCESASYDGFRSYGGIVAGEQVTVTGAASVPGLGERQESKILFDQSGQILAFVAEAPDADTLLIVFDWPLSPGDLSPTSMTHYLLQDDQAVLLMRIRIENVRTNEPLDEELFDVEAIGHS